MVDAERTGFEPTKENDMNLLILDLTILAFAAFCAFFAVQLSRVRTGRAAFGIFMLVYVGLVSLAVEGCSGAQRTWDQSAHIAVNTSTHALRMADTTINELYLREARQTHTIAALDAVDSRYHPALVAEETALASLQAAEHAIDTALVSGRSADKCLVRTLLIRARTHTADAIRIARALGAQIDENTVSSINAIEQVIASLAPSCPVESSSSPPSGGAP